MRKDAPEAAAPAPFWRRFVALTAFIVSQMRWRAGLTVAFMLIGSLTEGISVFLLFPILDFAQGGRIPLTVIAIPLRGDAGLGALLFAFVCLIGLRAFLLRHT